MFQRDKSRSIHPSTRPLRAALLPAALAALLGGPADALADDGTEGDQARETRSAEAELVALAHPARLRALAEHPDEERREELAAFLPELLVLLSPMERVEVVAGWSTSRSPHLRRAIAHALRRLGPGPTSPGTLTAIVHLADDPDPSVRAAVAEAAWLRRADDPTRLGAVLTRLARDEDRFVSETARLALGEG